MIHRIEGNQMLRELIDKWLVGGFQLFAGLSFLLLFFHKASNLVFGAEPITSGFFELSAGSFALLFAFGILLIGADFWPKREE